MCSKRVHLPLDVYDLPSYSDYRGIASCGRTVAAEAMGSFDGTCRVTCSDCRGDLTPEIRAKRAKALRTYLRKTKPQRPLNTSELETLGLTPADQDVRVAGKWAQRSLEELLNNSRAKTACTTPVDTTER